MVGYKQKNSNSNEQKVKPLEEGGRYKNKVIDHTPNGLHRVKHDSGRIVTIVGCRRRQDVGKIIDYEVTSIRPFSVWGMYIER